MSKHSSTSGLKSGFTLFEMLVSISIIALVSGVVFFNHSKFKSDTEITNLAYRMALDIRQAQVYSISVKQFDVGGVQNFNIPYGIHFKQNIPNSYIMFADAIGDADYPNGENDPTNGVYTTEPGEDSECDTGEDSECVKKIMIGRDIIIKGWCGLFWNGDPEDQGCISLDGFDVDGIDHYLDIKFNRPNPDAIFRVYEYDYRPLDRVSGFCENSDGTDVECTGWAICLVAPGGRQKQVMVYETGQISVQNVTEGSDVGCDSIPNPE